MKSGRYDIEKINMIREAIDKGMKVETIRKYLTPKIPIENLRTMLDCALSYGH